MFHGYLSVFYPLSGQYTVMTFVVFFLPLTMCLPIRFSQFPCPNRWIAAFAVNRLRPLDWYPAMSTLHTSMCILDAMAWIIVGLILPALATALGRRPKVLCAYLRRTPRYLAADQLCTDSWWVYSQSVSHRFCPKALLISTEIFHLCWSVCRLYCVGVSSSLSEKRRFLTKKRLFTSSSDASKISIIVCLNS